MDRTYTVYVHTNRKTGESYVGTTCDVKRRWRVNGLEYSYTKNVSKMWLALQKYGWDSFDHVILVEGLTKPEANEREKFFIAEYDSIRNGYNVSPGGIGGAIWEEGKHPWSGRTLTEEHKNKLSVLNKKRIAALKAGV